MKRNKSLINYIIESNTYLTEVVSMGGGELFKPNSNTGEARISILLNRIMKGEPIKLVNGQEIVVDPKASRDIVQALDSGDPEVIASVAGTGRNQPPVFVTKDGVGYKLSQLAKAEYFGGGGAARQSAEKTGAQESATAVVMGIAVMKGGQISSTDLTPANIKSSFSKIYEGPDSVKDVMEVLQEPQWAQSTVNTANAMVNGYDIQGVKIHRGSPWVRSLEKVYDKVARDAEGKKYFPNINKWNPADIWIVEQGVNPPAEDEVNNLMALNAWMTEMYELGSVVGVSLKLTLKGTKLKVFNYDDDLDDLLDITLKNLLVSKSNTLFSSKGSHIIYERDSALDIRQFKTQDNVNGEISGQYAAGGKVSYGPMNNILKDMNLPEIDHREIVRKMIDRNSKDKLQRHKKIINKIIKMAMEIAPEKARRAKKNMEEIAMEHDFNALSGKYQAVQLLYILKKTNTRKRKEFIQSAIQYASSRSDLSSVFVKIW